MNSMQRIVQYKLSSKILDILIDLSREKRSSNIGLKIFSNIGMLYMSIII